MQAKFVSQTGREFTIDIEGQQYSSTIPIGMEGKEDDVIAAFGEGKIYELLKQEAVPVKQSSFTEDDIIADVPVDAK